MPSGGKRKERTQRWIALSVEPETLVLICSALGEGRTLAEWCKEHDVRYMEVWEWLHDADFPKRAERYERAIESRKSLYTDVVLSGLRDVSQADVRRLYDGKGDLIDPHRLPDDLARVVVGVEEEEDARTGNMKRKVKLESRKTGHELLGRSLGLFKDRVEHEGKLTLEDLVNGSHQGDTHTPPRGERESASHPNPRSSSKT